MHIAIVIDCYYDTGNGTSVSARNLVRELMKRGVEATVLCTRAECGEQVGGERIVEFEAKKIPLYQKVIESQHVLLAEPNDGRICNALKGVDAVHIFMPFFLGTRTAHIAKALSIPVLGCYHLSAQNITYNAHMKYLPFATALTYDVLKRVHYKRNIIRDIYCPSRRIAQTLLTHGYKQSLHVISNGYDPNFKKQTACYENESGKIIINCVGRLTREKRQDLIIKAVAKSKHKGDISLYLAGDGAKKNRYIRLAKRLGVDLHIVYLNREELVKLHNNSYLYIQASDVETEGIACLEAIACGAVPIISDARMCATKQFALDKNSLFKHGSAKCLADKIDYWISHKIERNKKSYEYAELAKKYSLDRHVESLISVYEYMIARNGDNRYVVQDFNRYLKFEFACNDEKKNLTPTRATIRNLSAMMRKCLKS
ncbi:MAG: glycosyltransferase [Bacteroides sp.]|nr:glycosyltransferase [Bacillota bacterium]MCM1393405.1 glycosyltransferase [[Eubacterium] siraeum]MCM1455391.1 glycosyltransferase [Bacteroides sp.]